MCSAVGGQLAEMWLAEMKNMPRLHSLCFPLKFLALERINIQYFSSMFFLFFVCLFISLINVFITKLFIFYLFAFLERLFSACSPFRFGCDNQAHLARWTSGLHSSVILLVSIPSLCLYILRSVLN